MIDDTKMVPLFPPDHPHDMPHEHAAFIRETSEWTVRNHWKSHGFDWRSKAMQETLRALIDERISRTAGKVERFFHRYGVLAIAVVGIVIQGGMLYVALEALKK